MSNDNSAADWFARMHSPEAADARDAFAQWYADPAHATAYDHLIRTWDQSKFLANAPIGRARNLDLARPGNDHRRTVFALAAGILLAVALGVAGIGGLFRVGWRANGTPIATEIASSGDRQRMVGLSDGSRVILDRSSRLDLAFTGTERRLRLIAGRARFDVAHDPARPFVVEARGGSVIAHGTMFDVTIASRGIEVVLLRGAVEVRDPAWRATSQHVRHLRAGQKVAFTSGGMTEPVAATRADMEWRRAMIEFDATPLGDAVAAFSQSAGPRIVVEGAATRQLRVTGAFRRDDPEGFAATLAATFGLEVRRNSDASLSLVPRQPAGQAKKP